MIALASVWFALGALVLSLVMVVYRPAFNDIMVTIDLYATVFAFTFSGIVLWGTRKNPDLFVPVRLQAKVAIGLGLPAVGIVYLLVHFADRLPPP